MDVIVECTRTPGVLVVFERYYQLGDTLAREKVSSLFRDLLHSKTNQEKQIQSLRQKANREGELQSSYIPRLVSADNGETKKAQQSSDTFFDLFNTVSSVSARKDSIGSPSASVISFYNVVTNKPVFITEF